MSFVCRYLPSPGRSSPLSRPETLALQAAGLGILTIWETTAGAPGYKASGAAFFNAGRGAQEGALALQAAKALGQPAGTPIYATVDYDMQDADWPAVEAYLQAFQRALGGEYQLGVYGGYRVIDRVQQLTRWLWQTYAWSGGRLHQAAILYQYQNGVQIGGADTDLDRAFGDPGWWRQDGQPVTAAPAPPMERGGSAMPLTRSGDSGLAVKLLQTLLTVAGHVLAPDGDFGPATLEAVKAFQSEKGLTIDGIVGPLTWDALAKITPAPLASQQEPNDMATQIQNLTNALGDANNRLAQAQTRLHEFADLAAKPL